ncbi:GH25 family lysozyme [Brevibacillus sp. B_LB10_24]|uniref:GH25 family lysozyme n=1 Tax=Brevibacillus sp. B_LB10_24 TaxID=3380645 RepID=UPI0038BA6CFA
MLQTVSRGLYQGNKGCWVHSNPKFRTNVQGAVAAGLQIGFYHYCRPGTGNTPAAEAEWFVKR